jgi:hypothetical protein
MMLTYIKQLIEEEKPKDLLNEGTADKVQALSFRKGQESLAPIRSVPLLFFAVAGEPRAFAHIT